MKIIVCRVSFVFLLPILKSPIIKLSLNESCFDWAISCLKPVLHKQLTCLRHLICLEKEKKIKFSLNLTLMRKSLLRSQNFKAKIRGLKSKLILLLTLNGAFLQQLIMLVSLLSASILKNYSSFRHLTILKDYQSRHTFHPDYFILTKLLVSFH